MLTINREQLKNEIDQLDTAYLELLYNIIRQFPHAAAHVPKSPASSFSQRWRGKLGNPRLMQAELDADPRFAYLARRYQLS